MPIIDITVTSDFDAMCKAAERLLGPLSVHKRLAEHATEMTKDHLRKVSGERDHGSRFYESYAKVTHPVATADTAAVVIPPVFGKDATTQRGNPLSLHYWGGTLTKANLTSSKNYTIPNKATPEARHRRAREFPELKPLFRLVGGKREAFALGIPQSKTKRKKTGFAFKILYWLIKGFTIRPDTTVLPSQEDYFYNAEQTVVSLINRLGRGGAFGGTFQ